MRRSSLQLTLTPSERCALEHLVRCTTTPSGLVARAQMVLRFADGQRLRRIARELDYVRDVVRMWVVRYIDKRLEGLHDLPRSGRPPVFSPGRGHASGQARLRATG